MPTYRPDGSIQLDTENRIGSQGVGHEGAPATPVAYSDQWFRDSFEAMDGLQADRGYDHYDPAFRHGWEGAGRHRGRPWTDAERDLEQEWRSRNRDREWGEYRSAVRHAFDRAMHVFEGGPDPDRR